MALDIASETSIQAATSPAVAPPQLKVEQPDAIGIGFQFTTVAIVAATVFTALIYSVAALMKKIAGKPQEYQQAETSGAM